MTEETQPTPAATRSEVLVREILPAPGGSPAAFLSVVGPGPRGFFGDEDGWVAHAGAVRTVRVGPGERGSDGAEGGNGPTGRYLEVERARARLAEAASRGEGGSAPLPRLHGGFAFHPRHRATAEWEGFPAAGFVLPRLELHGGEGVAPTLVAQALLPAEEAGGEASRALRETLTGLRERLALGPNGSGGGADGVRLQQEGGVDRGRWEAAVEEILRAVGDGEVSKAVLARVLDVRSGGAGSAGDPVGVLERLREANPGARIFLWEPRAGRALVGAAPETLASLRHGRFQATAVAGSASVGSDEGDRARKARELQASRKDRMEHACTVEDMVSRLRGRMDELQWDPEPRVLALPRIQHLETRIQGAAASGETVLSLLEALHPTPAVCGLPRDRALDLVDRKEPFHRGWYAGPVGWVDSAGDGFFVPALRSAVGGPDGWRLFAGAGVVEGSDPALEWEETAMKFEPMLRALGADEGGRRRS